MQYEAADLDRHAIWMEARDRRVAGFLRGRGLLPEGGAVLDVGSGTGS